MARSRWTFALIIICLSILATVITAFRVRDLPRSNDKKDKCDDCDVKVRHKIQNVKIQSDKPKLQDLKKDKHETVHRNAPVQLEKPTHQFEVRSDEDEDDSEEHLLNVKIGFRQENSKVGGETKPAPKTSFFGIFDVDDDEEEDDDDGDDDEFENEDADEEKVNMKKIQQIIAGKFNWMKESKSTELSSSDEDLDKDDYESTDNVQKKVENKQKDSIKETKAKDINIVKEHQKVKVEEKVEVKNVVKTHKNDDENVLVKKIAPKISVQPQNVDKSQAQIPKIEIKKSEKKVDIKHDDDDDDEDDDDNEENLVRKAPSKVTAALSQQTDKPPLVTKEKTKDLPKKNVIEGSLDKTKATVKIANPTLKPTVESKKVEPPIKQETLKNYPKQDVKSKTSDNEAAKSNTKDTVKSSRSLKAEHQKAAKSSEVSNDNKVKESVKKPEKEHSPFVKSSEESKEPKSLKGQLKIPEHKDAPVTLRKDEKHGEIAKTFESKKNTKIITETKNVEKSFTNKDGSKEYLIDSEEIASRGESNLKHVSDALHRRNLLKSEFEDFYAFFPTFAPNFSHIHNSECRRHGQILLRQLRGMKLWALNMLDATAKIPSGILQGNGIQLGDFDQCLRSRARVQLESGSVVNVQGKYCLARVDVKAEHPELELPVHLAQAKNLIRSRLDDPGHFVPRFSTLSWGVCVPSPCGPEDVEVVIKDGIKHYQRTSGVVVRVKVDPDDCHVEEAGPWWTQWLELPTLLTLSFYGIIILAVLVTTTQDFFARRKTEGEAEEEHESKDQNDGEEKKESQGTDNALSAFSLYRTINKLVAPGTTDEISCIHGVRAIATVALLIAHKFLPIAVMPYNNRLQVTETVSSIIWSWCRAGWMYTDCFLLLSGTLTAHRISNDSTSTAPWRLLSRYIRLTPALLAVVLFYAYIWDHLSTGPMWGTFVTKNAQVCQEGWWWNLLYMQNYFGFEDMCTPQTHQLALDMQLTILGGLIVWAMQVKENLSLILFPALQFVAAYSRYTTVRDHRLTLLAYHGVSVSQLYRTARLSYMSVIHRSTSYLVGLSLGLALRIPKKHGMFLNTLGWVVSSVLWSLVWWAGIDSGSTQYRYNVTFAAQYAAFAPLASSIAIAWVIYAVHNETTGLLSNFLCSRPLVLISRLSYALFLCQFIVFITNVATVRTSSEFTVMSLVDIKEVCLILLSSTILTLTLVIPMQSMHKVFSSTSKTEETVSRKNSTNLEPIIEESHEEVEQNNKAEIPRRQYLVAHRELLEEIPETEIEYEIQREKTEGLEEILEEEEDDDDQNTIDDDLEIIEEEEGGEDEYWPEREEHSRRRLSNENNQDEEEWEWTTHGRSGAQHYRYNR